MVDVHTHAITLLHHASQMMLYALDHELLQAFSILFFLPSFWYRFILISTVQRMLFQKWSGFFRCFLVKSNLALFAPYSEPSVIALVKSSLDCRLWQWHVCLLEIVLLLAGCCERVFLYHGEDSRSSTTVVLCGHAGLFMFRSSPVRSFFSQNVPNCWFGHS